MKREVCCIWEEGKPIESGHYVVWVNGVKSEAWYDSVTNTLYGKEGIPIRGDRYSYLMEVPIKDFVRQWLSDNEEWKVGDLLATKKTPEKIICQIISINNGMGEFIEHDGFKVGDAVYKEGIGMMKGDLVRAMPLDLKRIQP